MSDGPQGGGEGDMKKKVTSGDEVLAMHGHAINDIMNEAVKK